MLEINSDTSHYRRALVLEGGGLRGNYTAGVLDAFLDSGAEFDYVIGVSAGAGMGCSYVSKQRGRNLEVLKRFRNDPRYLSVRSYLKTGDYFGLDFIYDEIPTKYIPFDTAAFNANGAQFISVATDVETGQAAYLDKGDDIMQAMKASSAMPFVSRIVECRGRKLLDGGIGDAIPLRKALADGCRDAVVVLTHPAGYVRKRDFHPPSRLFYRRYPRFIEALDTYIDRYNESLAFAEAEAAAGRVTIIRPSIDMHISRTEKSVERFIAFYELGLKDGAAGV
jgi:predicted patatin/cPLA2 family phospholipase